VLPNKLPSCSASIIERADNCRYAVTEALKQHDFQLALAGVDRDPALLLKEILAGTDLPLRGIVDIDQGKIVKKIRPATFTGTAPPSAGEGPFRCPQSNSPVLIPAVNAATRPRCSPVTGGPVAGMSDLPTIGDLVKSGSRAAPILQSARAFPPSPGLPGH
jgi:hypothetical protein